MKLPKLRSLIDYLVTIRDDIDGDEKVEGIAKPSRVVTLGWDNEDGDFSTDFPFSYPIQTQFIVHSDENIHLLAKEILEDLENSL